jgi:hypothetical protein
MRSSPTMMSQRAIVARMLRQLHWFRMMPAKLQNLVLANQG